MHLATFCSEFSGSQHQPAADAAKVQNYDFIIASAATGVSSAEMKVNRPAL